MMIGNNSKDLTAKDIIRGYCNSVLLNRTNTKVFPNFFYKKFECDILELSKSNYLYEYEVKVSRSDFKIDSKKSHRGTKKYDTLINGQRVNYFSYIVPYKLITIDEIPEWAGLVYVYGDIKANDNWEKGITEYYPDVYFQTIRKPQLLRKEKASDKEINDIINKLYFRFHALRCKMYNERLITPLIR